MINYLSYVWILLLLLITVTSKDVCWSIRNRVKLKVIFSPAMGFSLMFITAVWVLFFIKLRWPKIKSIDAAVLRNLKFKNCLKSMKVFSTNWERKFTNQKLCHLGLVTSDGFRCSDHDVTSKRKCSAFNWYYIGWTADSRILEPLNLFMGIKHSNCGEDFISSSRSFFFPRMALRVSYSSSKTGFLSLKIIKRQTDPYGKPMRSTKHIFLTNLPNI